MTSEKTKPATITKPFKTPNVCGPNGQNGNRHIVHMIITSTSQEDIKSADRISRSPMQVKTKTAGPWTKAGGGRPEDWPKWMRHVKDY